MNEAHFVLCRGGGDFDDEDPSTFEAELAMLDEVEAEMAGEPAPEQIGMNKV